jgi:hypothetical protein
MIREEFSPNLRPNDFRLFFQAKGKNPAILKRERINRAINIVDRLEGEELMSYLFDLKYSPLENVLYFWERRKSRKRGTYKVIEPLKYRLRRDES